MLTKVERQIRTADDFKTLLRSLISDLGLVNDYHTLFKDLAGAQQTYWRGMSQSPAFWGTVMGALQSAALYGLARVYDQNGGVLSLKTLLACVVSNNGAFLTRPADFDDRLLQADMASVDLETNQVVKHLTIWRGTSIAHRDPAKIFKPTLAAEYPITFAEVEQLIDQGFTILNRYDVAFFRNSTVRHVHGHDDYRRVLSTLNAVAEDRHAELMAQIEREDPV